METVKGAPPSRNRDGSIMFRPPGGLRRVVGDFASRFRAKGATSPDTAMTPQELGLPPRFEEAMKRRLGATGIFVEVDGTGKYYLDEARLQQIQQQRAARGWRDGAGGVGGGVGWASRGTMIALRMVRMVIGLAVVVLVLSNILFVESTALRLVILGLAALWVVLTVFQLYYLSRGRSRRANAGRPWVTSSSA
jgi:hypothetical protein